MVLLAAHFEFIKIGKLMWISWLTILDFFTTFICVFGAGKKYDKILYSNFRSIFVVEIPTAAKLRCAALRPQVRLRLRPKISAADRGTVRTTIHWN